MAELTIYQQYLMLVAMSKSVRDLYGIRDQTRESTVLEQEEKDSLHDVIKFRIERLEKEHQFYCETCDHPFDPVNVPSCCNDQCEIRVKKVTTTLANWKTFLRFYTGSQTPMMEPKKGLAPPGDQGGSLDWE